MAIRRGPHPTDNFTQIANKALRDKRLSWKARGILSYLMSHDQDWSITIEQIVSAGTDGRSAVRSGLAELKKFGYLDRRKERNRDSAGQWLDYDYIVTDLPEHGSVDNSPSSPESQNPTVDDRTCDDMPLYKKTIEKKTITKKTTVNGETAKNQMRPVDNSRLNGERQEATVQASKAQREYLRDLHLHGGGTLTGEIIEWIDGLTVAEADVEIRDALAALPRGIDYRGVPDSPDFTPKGQSMAYRKLMPVGGVAAGLHTPHKAPRSP